MDEHDEKRGRGGFPRQPAMDKADVMEMEKGIRLFNDRKFWHAHEAWEQVWRRKAGCCDTFFKGIIQAAAAFHKMKGGSVHGTRIHLDRALTKLPRYAPSFLGIDIRSFLEDLERCRTEIHQGRFPISDTPILKRSNGDS